MTNKTSSRALPQSDVELIERIVYKNGDDIARSFERLEERVDAAESRIRSKLDELSNELARVDRTKPVLTV